VTISQRIHCLTRTDFLGPALGCGLTASGENEHEDSAAAEVVAFSGVVRYTIPEDSGCKSTQVTLGTKTNQK